MNDTSPPTRISPTKFAHLVLSTRHYEQQIEFYRLLVRAGVPARCRNMIGTTHGLEIFSVACPEISADTAQSIADLARNGR